MLRFRSFLLFGWCFDMLASESWEWRIWVEFCNHFLSNSSMEDQSQTLRAGFLSVYLSFVRAAYPDTTRRRKENGLDCNIMEMIYFYDLILYVIFQFCIGVEMRKTTKRSGIGLAMPLNNLSSLFLCPSPSPLIHTANITEYERAHITS